MKKFDSWEEWESWAADVLGVISNIHNLSGIFEEGGFKEQSIAIDVVLEAIEDAVEAAKPLKEDENGS